MGTLESSKTWLPDVNTKDCSQSFCNLPCPQPCYIIFSPPPPFTFPDDSPQSGPNLSPLVIAVIGILVSAFLLVSYYAIISKYCVNSDASRRRENNDQPPVEHIEDNNPDHDELWFISNKGLDEALIKMITTIKYKKGDGLLGSNDCSVCLGEFLEDDTLRLLPKCSHAFHVVCIDTWLKSHSNCPLCRANIMASSLAQPIQPAPIILEVDDSVNSDNNLNDNSDHDESLLRNNETNRLNGEAVTGYQEQAGGTSRKNPFRAYSDLGDGHCREHEGQEGYAIRRSLSMDHSLEIRVTITDNSEYGDDEGFQRENREAQDELDHQCSKQAVAEGSKSGSNDRCNSFSRSGVLNYVMNSNAMKRSLSSGRFLFSKNGKGSSSVIPV